MRTGRWGFHGQSLIRDGVLTGETEKNVPVVYEENSMRYPIFLKIWVDKRHNV